MLKKVLSISNLGKFKNYHASGDVELRNLNLIYADNGQGKTTLSAVFRSLSENNPALLRGRRTLGQTGEVAVHLRFENQNISFTNALWNTSFNNLEIFDTRFIQDNIYVGNLVDIENKRALYKFVVGQTGVGLAHEVDAIDNNIKSFTSELNGIEKEIRRLIRSTLTVDEFIDLKQTDSSVLEKEIAQKESNFRASKQSEEIRSKASLRPLSISLPDFATIKTVLLQKMDDLSEDALKIVQSKISALGSDSQKWLAQGTTYIKESNCPFCENIVDGNSLIQSYRSFFSQRYQQLQGELTRLRKLFIVEVAKQAESIYQANNLSIDYWKQFTQNNNAPEDQFLIVKKSLESITDVVLSLIEQRERNLDADLSENEMLTKLESSFRQLNDSLDHYNHYVSTSNEKIESYKNQLVASQFNDLEKSLFILNDTKIRFSDESNTLCETVKELRSKKKELEGTKIQKRKQLDEYTKEVFPKYQTLINEFLLKFGSTFTIKDKASSHHGGKPGTSYKLVINDIPFEVGDENTPDHEPSFKNTLSEGEKSTLAFCYFLAKLALDASITEKIVVLDDPLSSFDSYRRDLTKQEVKRLSTKAKQIIVLSHDQYFLKLIWDDTKLTSRPLWIHRTTNGSTLSEWDIESATQSSYFKDCSKLHNFLEAGCSSESEMRDIARAIRPVLEHNLRVRCPNSFNVNGKWLGDFLEIISISQVGSPVFPLKSQYNDLDDINSFSKKYHHENSVADSEPISQTSLEMYVKKTFEAVAGIVTSSIPVV